MRSVLITDGGAGAIWFFGFFLVIAALGFALIVVKALAPAAGGSDADRGFAMKVAGAWLLGSALFAGGYGLFWSEVAEVRIEDDGTWSLRNAVGFELGALGGGVERTARVRWITADEIDHHESLVEHAPAELLIKSAGGDVLEVPIDAGAQGVLARLSYTPGGPCAAPDDATWFPLHTFTKRGPWCLATKAGKGKKGGSAAGTPVFALWSKDSWWYPARAGRSNPEKGTEVTYADGAKEWRKGPAERGPRKLPSVAHLQADWEAKGKYFPAVVQSDLGAGRYAVEYADGSKEEITDERLRFQLPRPGDLVFAVTAKDGWWRQSTVVRAALDGLVVRPATQEGDEPKTWQQVLPLQLPAGAKIEVGGKAAVVVAQTGTKATVRYDGDPAEATVGVESIRFQPRPR